jgi:hypothetical protein
MFEAGRTSSDTFNAMVKELRFRSTPRASTLLASVRRALNGGSPLSAAKQCDLFEHKTVVACQMSPPVDVKQISPLVDEYIPLEEAHKTLRVAPGSSWKIVEEKRRQFVQRAPPSQLAGLADNQQAAILREASRANAAYKVIAMYSK